MLPIWNQRCENEGVRQMSRYRFRWKKVLVRQKHSLVRASLDEVISVGGPIEYRQKLATDAPFRLR